MNILLIERYSQLIQDLIQHTDDILREVLANDELRQNIKHEWYPNNDIDWEAIVKAEADSYSFDPSIYPDNFFNE
ncbi:MAG: hypothetical protein AAF383_03880 [Cyanobacteria bacterium P01_A01_bin.83]